MLTRLKRWLNNSALCWGTPSSERADGESGVALVAVLWMVLLLAMIAGNIGMSVRSEVQLATAFKARAERLALAEGGLHKAIAALSDTDPKTKWSPYGSPYVYDFAGIKIDIAISNEASKIDLNTAPDALLGGLFVAVGVEQDEVPKLVDAIADWRDEDDLVRINGAEAGDYYGEGYDHAPRDAPFETVSELRRVFGVSEDLFDCVRPALTVHSHLSQVDARNASPLVLKAAGLTEQADHEQKSVISIASGVRQQVAGNTYEITSMVENTGIQAVVLITGNPRDPFWIFSWNELPISNESCSLGATNDKT